MIFKFNSWAYMLFPLMVLQFLNSNEKHRTRGHKFDEVHLKIGITGEEIELKW